MKIVNIGNEYSIKGDSLKIYDKLPAGVYTVCFEDMKGFFMTKHADLEVKEKVYGVHDSKVQKVMRNFENLDRSLGVILSGDKGIGKSLFSRLLSQMMINKGYPVILVDTYYKGIAGYLESIQQECMILFDEFDKTFYNCTPSGIDDPQTEMLGLFDGISSGKKLFVITCNSIYRMNNYIINRPGRFHYHFRFEYPNMEEIREYLNDKLKPEYHNEIPKVLSFSKKIDLNFDCLRSIVFEINNGEAFKDAIKDLNIVNTEERYYDMVVLFTNGQRAVLNRTHIDLFNDEEYQNWFDLENSKFSNTVLIKFNTSSCTYNDNTGSIIIPGNKIRKESDKDEEGYKEVDELVVDHLIIRPNRGKELHFAV